MAFWMPLSITFAPEILRVISLQRGVHTLVCTRTQLGNNQMIKNRMSRICITLTLIIFGGCAIQPKVEMSDRAKYSPGKSQVSIYRSAHFMSMGLDLAVTSSDGHFCFLKDGSAVTLNFESQKDFKLIMNEAKKTGDFFDPATIEVTFNFEPDQKADFQTGVGAIANGGLIGSLVNTAMVGSIDAESLKKIPGIKEVKGIRHPLSALSQEQKQKDFSSVTPTVCPFVVKG